MLKKGHPVTVVSFLFFCILLIKMNWNGKEKTQLHTVFLIEEQKRRAFDDN